jgi:hypothetical protein
MNGGSGAVVGLAERQALYRLNRSFDRECDNRNGLGVRIAHTRRVNTD